MLLIKSIRIICLWNTYKIILLLKVGVAILANAPERPKEKREERPEPEPRRPLQLREPRDARAESRAEAAARLRRAIKKLEEDDQPQLVRLGDASVAAPFTSRLSSILCSEYCFVMLLLCVVLQHRNS